MAKARSRAAAPVSQPLQQVISPDVAAALKVYTWATIEAKNLLLCISIAAHYGESVDDDLRPAIGIAVDGVARLLNYVTHEFEHLDGAILEAREAE